MPLQGRLTVNYLKFSYLHTLICSKMAVAIFVCMSISRFFSNSSGKELSATN